MDQNAMLPLIISDNQTIATKLRHALVHHGHDCPISNVVSIDNGARSLQAGHVKPDLILVALPEDLDRATELLTQLCDVSSAKKIAVGVANDPHRILDTLHAGAD